MIMILHEQLTKNEHPSSDASHKPHAACASPRLAEPPEPRGRGRRACKPRGASDSCHLKLKTIRMQALLLSMCMGESGWRAVELQKALPGLGRASAGLGRVWREGQCESRTAEVEVLDRSTETRDDVQRCIAQTAQIGIKASKRIANYHTMRTHIRISSFAIRWCANVSLATCSRLACSHTRHKPLENSRYTGGQLQLAHTLSVYHEFPHRLVIEICIGG